MTDISGQRFGRLTAIAEDRTRLRRLWLCECDCGRRKLVQRSNLINGGTRSCGCYIRDTARARFYGLPRPEVCP